MKNIWTFILIFSLSCCNKHHNKDKIDVLIDYFPKNINLSPIEIEVPNILFNPIQLCTIDSFLVILQIRSESIVNIFLTPDCQYISSFGRRGRGPDELIPSFNHTFKPVYGKNSGFTLGNKKFDINYYKMKDIINKNFNP